MILIQKYGGSSLSTTEKILKVAKKIIDTKSKNQKNSDSHWLFQLKERSQILF